MTDDEISAEIEKVREEVWQNKLKRGETRRELEQAMAEAVLHLLSAKGTADDDERKAQKVRKALREWRNCRGIE